ncbi:MAG: iron-sulfur cluster assembly protein [Thermoanaerobaculales bacterium]|nr:iron-sulfur cluster assembly protein [Thermoanaerobaculales bacterium]
MSDLRDAVIEVLKTVYDPEIPVNIWEVGLIYEVAVDDGANVRILMNLGPALGPGDDERGGEARAGHVLINFEFSIWNFEFRARRPHGSDLNG